MSVNAFLIPPREIRVRACVRTVTLLSSSAWPPRMMRERPSREGRPPLEADASTNTPRVMRRVMAARSDLPLALGAFGLATTATSRKRKNENDSLAAADSAAVF